MYFFATFPIKYLRLSLKANLSAARARVVLPSESCNASLGPWSPCVSAVRPGVADRRPRQTGGHRRVTGGFVPRRDELRLETRRARVKPELQRLRWAGGREHGRGWQEGDRPESDRQRTTCASAALAATGASRRSHPTPTACPYRLPLANTSWTNHGDATALRLCLPRSYCLTSDTAICVQKAVLGARDAQEPPRCLRRYAQRGLPASRRCPRVTRVRARVVRAELDGLGDGSWLWPRLFHPIHLRFRPKPSFPPPVTLVAPEVGCGVRPAARRDHEHVARLASRLAPRVLSPPLAPRTCVHATRLGSNRGVRGSPEENL